MEISKILGIVVLKWVSNKIMLKSDFVKTLSHLWKFGYWDGILNRDLCPHIHGNEENKFITHATRT